MINSRRDFLIATAAAVFGAGVSHAAEPAGGHQSPYQFPAGWTGNESISIVLYDGFTALDVFGPHHMFILMMGAKVHLVAASLDPVVSDSGIKITPTMTFEDAPQHSTILFIPGGSKGTLAAAENKLIVDFIADRGFKAEWIVSVCTGSVLLGVAGLLRGYRATSHWLVRDALADFGAIPVNERVVADRNRITGAGVTAGLDLSLSLVGRLRSDDYAKSVQLFSEYDPQPPYQCGSPEKSAPATVEMLVEMHSSFSKQVRAIAARCKNSS